MGWNCFGLPYLVHTYKPYEKETFHDDAYEHYNMDIPHKLWLYYDGKFHSDGTTAANEHGGYYSVSSWDTSDWHLPSGETPSIWLGEGIFTQTAAVSDTEELRFYRPLPPSGISGGAKQMTIATTSYYYGDSTKEDTTPKFDIYTRGNMVYVTGLQGNENITIHDSTGRIYNMAKATDTKYSFPQPSVRDLSHLILSP